MTSNLIDTVKGLITPQMVDKAAASTGESPVNASKALHGSVPLIFGALAQRSSTPEGASSVFEMIRVAAPSGAIEKLVGSAGETLATSSGVKSSSVSRILEFAAPLVVGVLGKEVASRGLNAGGLAQLLSSQKTALPEEAHAPPSVTTTPAGHAGPRFRDIEQLAATRLRDVEQRAAATAKGSPWKLILLALVVVALIISGIAASVRRHAPHVGVTAVQPAAPSAPTVQAPPAPAPPAPVAAPPAGVVLPNGGTLDVAPDSPEAAFAHDLADSSVVLPRSFQFDDLSFSSRSAALGADADKTMDAVAATLNAYPSARVRIEGHSGNVGSPAANRALAAARARAVKDMLVARGVAPNRIDTPTGRGMVPPGRAEAGPRTNRRAEIVLLNR